MVEQILDIATPTVLHGVQRTRIARLDVYAHANEKFRSQQRWQAQSLENQTSR